MQKGPWRVQDSMGQEAGIAKKGLSRVKKSMKIQPFVDYLALSFQRISAFPHLKPAKLGLKSARLAKFG